MSLMGFQAGKLGQDAVFGLELTAVDRCEYAENDYAEMLQRLLAVIDGHPRTRLVLQVAVSPNAGAPQRGHLDIHLFGVGDGSDWARLEELGEDLLDLLSTPPRPWSFRRVTDRGELDRVLAAVPVGHISEIARREAPCPAPERFPPAGYHTDRSDEQPSLWSLWRFSHEERRDAGLVLLSQDAPIVIRTIISPVDLTVTERDALEDLVDLAGAETPLRGIRAASGRVLERMLVSRPLYEVRTLVASPDPIGASVLSAIGWSMSPPRDAGTDGLLEGGFTTVRGGDLTLSMQRAFATLDLGDPLPTEAPPRLGRLRRILTMSEAAAAFTLPRPTVSGSPGLESSRLPIGEAPIADLPEEGVLVGSAAVGAEVHGVRLADPDRMRHLYLTGQTGTGKSTLMGNLILHDIEEGAGVAVVDPHGSLAQAILERIPEDRIEDVIVIEPADPSAVVGVNLLEAETDIQQTFVVAELCAMFYTLFDPHHTGIVGPRYESWLRNGAHLLLANPDRSSTFLDIPTLFTDGAVRRSLVDKLDDPTLSEFWTGEMAQLSDYHLSELLGWFRSKFEPFRMSAPVRRIVGQAASTISFDRILAERRILIVNLSKGLLGGYNANLIGFVILTRLWQSILGRATLPVRERSEFFVYVDEFQSLTTSSLAEMLSEARKFGVGVTLANQFLGQVPEALRAAIIGNVASRMAFRLGPTDAAMFSSWMGSSIVDEDLTHLPNFTAIAALASHGEPLDPFPVGTLPLRGAGDPDRANTVRERSRKLWATPVDEIDRAFRERWADVEGSLAHRVLHPPDPAERPPRGRGDSSFLDDWIKKRRSARIAGTDSGDDSEPDVDDASADLPAAEPGERPSDEAEPQELTDIS